MAKEPTDDEIQAAAATIESIADMKKAVQRLQKALEVDMFYGSPGHQAQEKLKSFLGKLGIKSARRAIGGLAFGGALKMEDLEATMKQVEFNVEKLKLWKNPK